jgi:acylglycerol lipase
MQTKSMQTKSMPTNSMQNNSMQNNLKATLLFSLALIGLSSFPALGAATRHATNQAHSRLKGAHVTSTVPLHAIKPTPVSAPVCIVNSTIGQQLNLPIYEWIDKTRASKGIIVAVPGMTLYAFSWNDMAMHLASQGYRVFSLDQRGFGRWRTESAKFGGTNKIEIGQSEQDLLDLVTDLRQAHPNQKLFLLGESLGSNMALALVSEHPKLADGAILGSPCYKTRMHAKPLHWAEDFARTIIKPNRAINLEPYSAPYLTNDPALAKACNNDPLIYRKMNTADLIKIDLMNDRAIGAAKNLPAGFPLLIIAGSKDAMFKSTELPKAIEKFGSKNIELHLLAGKGHLLMEHQTVQPAIGTLIDTWLVKQSAANSPNQK